MSRNKIFAAVALIIGLILVVVVFTDFPPEDSSIAGTMADPDKKIAGVEKADRYRSDQMDADDVEIDDATFQTLMQNEDFVEIVSNGSFALAEALDRALDRVDVRRADVYARLAGDRSLSRAAAEFDRASNDDDFARAEDFLKGELEKALSRAFDRGAFDRAKFDREGFDREDLDREGLDKADMEKALDRAGMEKVGGLDRDAMEKAAFDRDAMERALDRGEMARILSREDLDRAFEKGLAREMARDMARGMEKADWARAANFEKVLARADGDWARLFNRSSLARIFERGYARSGAERSVGERADQARSAGERAER
ncbi:MAG: hypothetical protein O6942_08530 [Bacteroidetes bacterium]|nr:hypothetical protein [Bacteroidota bacterium]